MKNNFALIFGCLTLMACATHPDCSFTDIVGMNYHEGREIMLHNGWRPTAAFRDSALKKDEEEFGYTHPLLQLGYEELGACAGIGTAYCDFYFQNNNGEYLRVIAEGEDNGPTAKKQARITSYEKFEWTDIRD